MIRVKQTVSRRAPWAALAAVLLMAGPNCGKALGAWPLQFARKPTKPVQIHEGKAAVNFEFQLGEAFDP